MKYLLFSLVLFFVSCVNTNKKKVIVDEQKIDNIFYDNYQITYEILQAHGYRYSKSFVIPGIEKIISDSYGDTLIVFSFTEINGEKIILCKHVDIPKFTIRGNDFEKWAKAQGLIITCKKEVYSGHEKHFFVPVRHIESNYLYDICVHHNDILSFSISYHPKYNKYSDYYHKK
jgi:hypothetical protein